MKSVLVSFFLDSVFGPEVSRPPRCPLAGVSLHSICKLLVCALLPALLLPGLVVARAPAYVVGTLVLGQASAVCIIEEHLYAGKNIIADRS